MLLIVHIRTGCFFQDRLPIPGPSSPWPYLLLVSGFIQIVRLDRTMEQIVFPVPNICEFLTNESKLRVYYTTERDEQGSKINDFFLRSEDLFNEMNWQKKLRGTQEGPGNTNTFPCAFSSYLALELSYRPLTLP